MRHCPLQETDRKAGRHTDRQTETDRMAHTNMPLKSCTPYSRPLPLPPICWHTSRQTDRPRQTDTDTQPKLASHSSHSLCSMQLIVQRITAFPLTGTKFLALWHSSKMRQPSNCGPPHQSISCCSRVLRVLLNFPGNKHTQSKQQQNVNKQRNQTTISTENQLLHFPEKITSTHNQNNNKI